MLMTWRRFRSRTLVRDAYMIHPQAEQGVQRVLGGGGDNPDQVRVHDRSGLTCCRMDPENHVHAVGIDLQRPDPKIWPIP